jgi:hypothetical protein
MRHVDVGDQLEELRAEVRRRADARGGERELARLLLRQLDQLLHARHAERGVDEKTIVGAREARDRLEIGLRVVGQLLRHRGIHGERDVDRDEQRVAVGRGARDVVRADGPGGAGDVLDHHGVAPALAQLLRHHARQHVERAARRERHHELHRPRRISLLRERRQGEER